MAQFHSVTNGFSTVRLWQAPPPARVHREPAEKPRIAQPTETIRLFELEVIGNAQAMLNYDGGAHEVQVTAVNPTDWYVQLHEMFDDLEEGATYTIRFQAKADAPRRINLNAQRNGTPDWKNIGLAKSFSLTEQWEKHEVQFQAKNLAAVNKITFILGQQTGTVWIKDFTVTKSAK